MCRPEGSLRARRFTAVAAVSCAGFAVTVARGGLAVTVTVTPPPLPGSFAPPEPLDPLAFSGPFVPFGFFGPADGGTEGPGDGEALSDTVETGPDPSAPGPVPVFAPRLDRAVSSRCPPSSDPPVPSI